MTTTMEQEPLRENYLTRAYDLAASAVLWVFARHTTTSSHGENFVGAAPNPYERSTWMSDAEMVEADYLASLALTNGASYGVEGLSS